MTSEIPGDWFPAPLPPNIALGEGAYIETSYSFRQFSSRRVPGLRMGDHAAAYMGCTFAVGAEGIVSIGDYSLLNGVYIYCQERVEIGNRVLIAWNVGILDSHGLPRPARQRAERILSAQNDPCGRMPASPADPVVIEDDVWIGFGAIVLPGVRIGAGSIIGAQAVVTRSVPAGVVAAGNPARVVRPLTRESRPERRADRC